jgi:hypothetical protein
VNPKNFQALTSGERLSSMSQKRIKRREGGHAGYYVSTATPAGMSQFRVAMKTKSDQRS